MYRLRGMWCLSLLFCLSLCGYGQTLIINEISNGINGNKEYIELLVVDTGAVYDCTQLSDPPCVDVRGWILDDNSGYHGPTGVAAGCMRFADIPFWSCLPVGTLILIYNSADKGPAIPPDDRLLADGNCTLILPDTSNLLSFNATTPGAVACNYPAAGWTTGGNWNSSLLANSGDCARIVNLSGCEVFSMCWAAANQNNQVYFNANGSGSGKVWWFNTGNPFDQQNWQEGTALINETPGLANGPENLSYIYRFNNGCQAISPLQVQLSSTLPSCICDGSLEVLASGSISPYRVLWSTGDTTPTIQQLCPGNYAAIIESAIGCKDSISFYLPVFQNTLNISFSGDTILSCSNLSCLLQAESNSNAVNFTWYTGQMDFLLDNPNISFTQSGNYWLSGIDSNSCRDSIPITILLDTLSPLLQPMLIEEANCYGQTAIYTVLSDTYPLSIVWDGQLTNDTVSLTGIGWHEVVITNPGNGCSQNDSVEIILPPAMQTNILSIQNPTCYGDSNGNFTIQMASFSPPVYIHPLNNPVPSDSSSNGTFQINGLSQGNYTWVMEDYFHCPDTVMVSLNDPEILSLQISLSDTAVCSGNPVSIQGMVTGGTPNYTYIWNQNAQGNTITIQPLQDTLIQLTVNDQNNCSIENSVLIPVKATANSQFQLSPEQACAPFCVNLSPSQIDSNTIYTWTCSDGSQISNTYANICFTIPGDYDISLTANAAGKCISHSSKNQIIHIFPSPESHFSISPETPTWTSPQIDLIGSGSGQWYIDGQQIYEGSTLAYYLEDTMYHHITLIVENQYGCRDSSIDSIKISEDFLFYIPNSFSPNGDGLNDFFTIKGSGLDPLSFQMLIYNRWGQLIYSQNNWLEKGWDGNYQNKEAIEDTYAYLITIQPKSNIVGGKKILKGHLNLIR